MDTPKLQNFLFGTSLEWSESSRNPLFMISLWTPHISQNMSLGDCVRWVIWMSIIYDENMKITISE